MSLFDWASVEITGESSLDGRSVSYWMDLYISKGELLEDVLGNGVRLFLERKGYFGVPESMPYLLLEVEFGGEKTQWDMQYPEEPTRSDLPPGRVYC